MYRYGGKVPALGVKELSAPTEIGKEVNFVENRIPMICLGVGFCCI